MREQAIAEYHELLAADESLNAGFFAHLKEQMRARRLTYGGRELGVALRPHILTGTQYGALIHASETLASAFERIGEAVTADQSLLECLGLTERERRMALINPGFKRSAVTTRFDAFLRGDEIKFVEYNAENPSSLTDQDGLNEVLSEVGAMRRLTENYRFRQLSPARSLLTALLAIYREWGGMGAPHVAIVDWVDLPTANEFILLREYFASCSVEAVICTPDELEYKNHQLRCGDFRIDLVYKRVIIHEFLARYDETHPLSQAYSNGNVCVVNPFRCKLLHKKAAFELLTDEMHTGWFNTVELEVIRRCVPWTRRLTARHTNYDGRKIDLLEHIRRERASFVLKPNDDYGGRGIFFGYRASAGEWDEMIETALAADYIVQEIIELEAEAFPIFDEQQWSLQPMYVDTNPFLFNGKVDGALVRLSDSPIVNVTSGGGETGFVVVEERLT